MVSVAQVVRLEILTRKDPICVKRKHPGAAPAPSRRPATPGRHAARPSVTGRHGTHDRQVPEHYPPLKGKNLRDVTQGAAAAGTTTRAASSGIRCRALDK